jgi:hypothetical protein
MATAANPLRTDEGLGVATTSQLVAADAGGATEARTRQAISAKPDQIRVLASVRVTVTVAMPVLPSNGAKVVRGRGGRGFLSDAGNATLEVSISARGLSPTKPGE